MKLTLSLVLSTLVLSTTALPYSLTSLIARGCTPAEGVATDGNQYWADNCDLGAGEDGWGQKAKRMVDAVLSKRHGDWGHWGNNNWGNNNWGNNNQNNNNDKNNNQNNQNNQNNNNNGGHDANWNGVYEQTPNCTPADGVATDGNQFWADNCDGGAGEDGFGQ